MCGGTTVESPAESRQNRIFGEDIPFFLLFQEETKMFRKAMAFAAVMALSAAAYAGQYEEVPYVPGQPMPPANIGEAWCIYVYPAEYETISEQVMVRPETMAMTPVAPVYGRRTETFVCAPEHQVGFPVAPQFARQAIPVVCVPEHEILVAVPPRFVTEQIPVEICPAYEEAFWVPATFRTEPRTFEICPERKELRKVQCVDGTMIDCYTVVGAPAKTETVNIQVLDQPGRIDKRVVPAKTQMVTVQKLAEPARMDRRVVPAQIQNIDGAVVSVPASVRVETVPAKVGTVTMLTIEREASIDSVRVDAVYRTQTRQQLKTPERVVWRKQPLSQIGAAATFAPPAPVMVSETVAEQVVADYGSIPGTAATRLIYR